MTREIHEIGIAVDFGMTGSAVAWTWAEHPEKINIIDNWGGGIVNCRGKVPTRVAIDQSDNFLSWGFQCNKYDGNTKELFKMWLDKAFIGSHDRLWLPQGSPQRSYESEQWSCFYIHSLIKQAILCIEEKICEGANTSLQLNINYIVSTPTTWDVNTVGTFRSLVQRAITDAHRTPEVQAYAASLKTLSSDITESEAVANLVYDNRQFFNDGDTFLVLDVGGATADIFIARIVKKLGHYVCSPHTGGFVPGVSRGIIDVDWKFQSDAWHRLRKAGHPDPLGVSCEMREGGSFKYLKKTYVGSPKPQYVPIPGIEATFVDDAAGICLGEMKFSGAEFSAIFDDALMNNVRARMLEAVNLLSKPPKYLVLAGGGSHPAYVHDSLKDIAPGICARNPTAVAEGCLVRWQKQLRMMTVLFIQGTLYEKLQVGTSEREPGQKFATHTWENQKISGRYMTTSCAVSFPLEQNPRWQCFELAIEAKELPYSLENMHELDDRRTASFRVDIRLPSIKPYLLCEDVTACTAGGVKVGCTVTSTTPVNYEDHPLTRLSEAPGGD